MGRQRRRPGPLPDGDRAALRHAADRFDLAGGHGGRAGGARRGPPGGAARDARALPRGVDGEPAGAHVGDPPTDPVRRVRHREPLRATGLGAPRSVPSFVPRPAVSGSRTEDRGGPPGDGGRCLPDTDDAGVGAPGRPAGEPGGPLPAVRPPPGRPRAPHEPDPWLDDPPPRAARRCRARRPGRAGTTTARARVGPGDARGDAGDVGATRPVDPWSPSRTTNAPVTDPFGFPPVPPVQAARDRAPAWAARGRTAYRAARDTAEPAMDGRVQESALVRPTRCRRGPTERLAGAVAPAPLPIVRSPTRARPARTPGRTFEHDRAEPDQLPAELGRPTGRDDLAASTAPGSPRRTDCPTRPRPPRWPGRSRPTTCPGTRTTRLGAGARWPTTCPAPGDDHALLGWSGAGRQRAEIVLPGAVRPDGEGRLLVDVRVRVTPYRRVSRSEATPEPDPRDALGTPAAAPSVTARGWRGLAARWVRLGVTVVRDGDGSSSMRARRRSTSPTTSRRPPVPAPPRTARPAEDPTLDGDDVVATGSRR